MTDKDSQLPGFVQMARHFGITLASEDAPKLAHIIGHYVAQEREACAKACDEVQAKSRNSLFRSGAGICAGEIRARR